jgi:hypothetical protein
MNHISKICRLKEGSAKTPDRYLGANIGLWTMEGGRRAWSTVKVVLPSPPRGGLPPLVHFFATKSAVCNLENKMGRPTIANLLPTKAYQPFKTGDRPEIDVSPTLSPQEVSYYQGLTLLDMRIRKDGYSY